MIQRSLVLENLHLGQRLSLFTAKRSQNFPVGVLENLEATKTAHPKMIAKVA